MDILRGAGGQNEHILLRFFNKQLKKGTCLHEVVITNTFFY